MPPQFPLRVKPWSRCVIAKLSIFALLTSNLGLVFVCGKIDASVLGTDSSIQEYQEGTSDLASLLSLGLQPEPEGLNEVIAQLDIRLQAGVRVKNTQSRSQHSSSRTEPKHISITNYKAFRKNIPGAAEGDRENAQQLIVKKLGNGWLQDLRLLEDQHRLLKNVVPKLFEEWKEHRPSTSWSEASLTKKIDHSIKLALHYIQILHGLFVIGPLFRNDAGLKMVQKAAYEGWTGLFYKLDLLAPERLSNDAGTDPEWQLANQIRSPGRTPGSVNAVAWTLLSYSFAEFKMAYGFTLGYGTSGFHKDLKTAVVDAAIRRANQAKIHCKVEDKVGPVLLKLETSDLFSQPTHKTVHDLNSP